MRPLEPRVDQFEGTPVKNIVKKGPPPHPLQVNPIPELEPANGALVVAITAFCFSLLPFWYFISYPLGIGAVISAARSHSQGRKLATAALWIGIATLLVPSLVIAVFFAIHTSQR